MANPSSPASPPLKRFARLEMDGDPAPQPRPAKKSLPVVADTRVRPIVRDPPLEGPDVARARELAAELSDNARQSLAQTTPQARRADRAEQLRSRMNGPAMSAPMPAGTTTRTLRFDVGPLPAAEPARRVEPRRPLPGIDATPGVVIMEVDLSPRGVRVEAYPQPSYPPSAAPGVRFDTAPRARAEAAPGPIELTPMAARQVMLMAWEAGMPGSGLRILTSWTPGLGGPELDFAFDDDVTADDHVFLSNGVRIIVDSQSLVHVRGRRITWHDVPGSEGFAVR